MPGLIERTWKFWLGAVSKPSRSVKTSVPDAPSTGPNGAAKSRSAEEYSPVLVMAPSAHAIRPCPLTSPRVFAIVPFAR